MRVAAITACAFALTVGSNDTHQRLRESCENRVPTDSLFAACTALIERRIDPETGYFFRGAAHYQSDRFNEAEADFSKAILISPLNPAYLNNRGAARRMLKNLLGAVADYDRAIELDPNRGNTYHNRGIALGDLGESSRAIEDYDTAITMDRSNAWAYRNRGLERHKTGDRRAAISDISVAIQIEPNADFYMTRGDFYSSSDRWVEALEDYWLAVRTAPHPDVEVLDRLAHALLRTRNAAEAVVVARQAIARDEKDGWAWETLGEALEATGEEGEAVKAYQQALELRPDLATAKAGLDRLQRGAKSSPGAEGGSSQE